MWPPFGLDMLPFFLELETWAQEYLSRLSPTPETEEKCEEACKHFIYSNCYL